MWNPFYGEGGRCGKFLRTVFIVGTKEKDEIGESYDGVLKTSAEAFDKVQNGR